MHVSQSSVGCYFISRSKGHPKQRAISEQRSVKINHALGKQRTASPLHTLQTPRNMLIILYANIIRYQIACQFVSRLLPNEQLICPLESRTKLDKRFLQKVPFIFDRLHHKTVTPYPSRLLLSPRVFEIAGKTRLKRGFWLTPKRQDHKHSEGSRGSRAALGFRYGATNPSPAVYPARTTSKPVCCNYEAGI